MIEYIILFKADEWHSNESKSTLGVFDSIDAAITALDESDVRLSRDDKENLFRMGQTQGRNVNYIIDAFQLNTISERYFDDQDEWTDYPRSDWREFIDELEEDDEDRNLTYEDWVKQQKVNNNEV